MYLEDIVTSMSRIEEYIEGYTFIQFKKDYKTVDAIITNHLPENQIQIQNIL